MRRDCSLPADLSVLTADEVAFRDLLVLATAGAADALWLARLLQWLAARGLTHLVLQLEGPAVVRLLERHARRDVLLPRYYAVHGDALNGARAFYAAATAPVRTPSNSAAPLGHTVSASRAAHASARCSTVCVRTTAPARVGAHPGSVAPGGRAAAPASSASRVV